MIFIITLISLVIERFFHWGQLRHWRWFLQYQSWLSHSRINNWSSAFLLILSVLPFVMLVGIVNIVLDDWLYGSLKLLFGFAVLMYCLGPANFWMQAYNCIDELHKEDQQEAIARVNAVFGLTGAENAQTFHQAFTRAIFLAAHQRVFAVVFWFTLLGPLGALLYRLISLISAESPLGLTRIALATRHLLDWLPVRLFTFIFALGGHFARVFTLWRQQIWQKPEANDVLLASCGIASIDGIEGRLLPENGEAEKEALALLDRVFVMSLVILAMLVLLV